MLDHDILRHLPCPEGRLFRKLRAFPYPEWSALFADLRRRGLVWYVGGKVFGGVTPRRLEGSINIVSKYLKTHAGVIPNADPEPENHPEFQQDPKSVYIKENGRVVKSAEWEDVDREKRRQSYETKPLTDRQKKSRAEYRKRWMADHPGDERRKINITSWCAKCGILKRTDGSDGLEGFSPDNSRWTGWNRTCRQCRRKEKTRND